MADIEPLPAGVTHDEAVGKIGRYIIAHQEVIRSKHPKARRLLDRIERTLSRSDLEDMMTLYRQLIEISDNNYDL